MPQEFFKLVSDELKAELREVVETAYLERPSYAWIGEDILEELEEVIGDELDLMKDEYPTTATGEMIAWKGGIYGFE